jgi:Ydr279p protein triple barrel domain/Ydr279p protein family (RNase H2 complex component) wHTH domain
MDSQRVLLVNDDIASLKGIFLATLPHPKTKLHSKFLIGNNSIFEVQVCSQNTPSSIFVNQRIVSNGNVLVATKIDVTFFLLNSLPHVFVPIEDIIASSSTLSTIKRYNGFPVDVDKVFSALCDVQVSESQKKYKLNVKKVTDNLSKRFIRLSSLLKKPSTQNGNKLSTSFSFSSKSTRKSSPTSPNVDTGISNSQIQEDAESILGEYVSTEWINRMNSNLNLVKVESPSPKVDVSPSSTTIPYEDAESAYDQLGLQDPIESVQKFLATNSRDNSTPVVKKTPVSASKKKLESASKGSKSLADFFKK